MAIDWEHKRHEFAYEKQAEIMVERLGSKATVLDIGCGSGYGSAILSAEGNEVIGLDLDRVVIPHHDGFRVWNALTDQIPGGHDVIVANQFIEHLEKPSEFISAALTALNSGGLLMITTPNKDARFPDHMESSTPEHYQEYTRLSISSLFDSEPDVLGVYGNESVVIHDILRRMGVHVNLAMLDPLGICARTGVIKRIEHSIREAIGDFKKDQSPSEGDGSFTLAPAEDNKYPLDLFLVISKEAA